MNNVFENLFILDLANNHEGDVEHTKTLVKEISDVVKKYKVRVAIKFQFRDLETFIHKHKKHLGENKVVDRLLSTRLTDEQFFEIKKYIDSLNLLTACTPFDEISVEKVIKMGFDYIKIASCSAQDWSLVEKIRDTQMPLIASVGGLNLEEIDKLVYFISKKRKQFALMHCIAIYPTPDELFNLERINILNRKYPNLEIGWSTHEDHNDYQTINLAYSLGARVFEKHIGKNTEKYRLSQYSATSYNIDQWLDSFVKMKKKIVINEHIFLKKQEPAIRRLVRGIFAKKDIEKNAEIQKGDFYYAFPSDKDSIKCSNDFEFIKARENIKKDAALTENNTIYKVNHVDLIEKAILKLRMFLQKHNFSVKRYNHIDISCYYGLDKFYSVGSCSMGCLKDPYIKKIVAMLPGQRHPSHKHIDRSQLYSMIAGDLTLKIDDKIVNLKEGKQIVVNKNQYHEFCTSDGAIFEEISYTENHTKSEYKDDEINRMDRSRRIIRIEEKIL